MYTHIKGVIMSIINGIFIDYADICAALTKEYGTPEDSVDYFYFFEECEDEGHLDNCNTYAEVEQVVLRLYEEQRADDVWELV